jgi:hypothetical protein
VSECQAIEKDTNSLLRQKTNPLRSLPHGIHAMNQHKLQNNANEKETAHPSGIDDSLEKKRDTEVCLDQYERENQSQHHLFQS